MTDVACLNVVTEASFVTMRSTLRRTNSAAISAMRSGLPSVQRYSIAMVRPSIQPSARSRSTKTTFHAAQNDALEPANPDGWRLAGLLRTRCERPHRRRATEQRQEIATLQSIELHVQPQLGTEAAYPIDKDQVRGCCAARFRHRLPPLGAILCHQALCPQPFHSPDWPESRHIPIGSSSARHLAHY